MFAFSITENDRQKKPLNDSAANDLSKSFPFNIKCIKYQRVIGCIVYTYYVRRKFKMNENFCIEYMYCTETQRSSKDTTHLTPHTIKYPTLVHEVPQRLFRSLQ